MNATPYLSCVQGNFNLVEVVKTIDWLVDNTSVSVFNPISFSGYQRQIDKKHCDGIVNFLKQDFIMPTAIVCACDGEYTDDCSLRIVDGQHRVEAFRILRETNFVRYEEIKHFGIPVIVMVNPAIEKEVDTFITINKTSKKVDTSLAYVLKSKLMASGDDSVMPRAEYLSAEVAFALNNNELNPVWCNCILFEGSVRNSNQCISLNAFVRATRVYVNFLQKRELISYQWENSQQILAIVKELAKTISITWDEIFALWPDLFLGPLEDRQILQGSLGYTALTRVLIRKLSEEDTFASWDELRDKIRGYIRSIDLKSDCWKKGVWFSNYSSESGYRVVSDEIYQHILK